MMKNKIVYKLLLLGFAVFFSWANTISAQNQDEGTSVTATIVDENGDPLSDVNIYAPQGISATTDAEGNFEIVVPSTVSLVFEKDGFDSKIRPVTELSDSVVLGKSPFLASTNDEIEMGISTKLKRNMVGAASIINPSDRLTYDNTQSVRDYIQGMLPGVKGSSNVRGLGGALFVIDGVIGRDPDILSMEEVEQITVLKDANSLALYGAQAENGVIVINTKRGKVNQRYANVNVRYGMEDPIFFPEYLESARYMELYNEARANDGLDAFYDADEIENYRSGSNPYRYPDVDLYSGEYLRSMTRTADVVTEFSGGNETTQYYVNAGWTHDQSLVELNPDANVGQNQFNVRGNVDFRVNNFITSSVDAVGIISSNKRANTNLLQQGGTLKPNAYAPLLPVSMMDTTSNAELAARIEAANIYDGMLLGSSQAYQENAPIADVIAGGYTNSMFRSTQFNNSTDFDLDMITEGLSARAYLSFDFYDGYDVSITNDFRTYEPTWEDDQITALTPYGDVDRKDLTESVSTNDYISRVGAYGFINYERSLKEDHNFNIAAIGYFNSMKRTNVLQTNKNSHIGLQINYDYKKKLFADFSGAYIHSIKLPEGNRGGFSPTGGLAYILSEEDFFKDVGFIDFLKLKATAGIIKSDVGIDQYYMYKETYSEGDGFNWADGGYSNNEMDISQGANEMMTFEERIDINLGVESQFFNSLWFEMNYFKSDRDNQLTRLGYQYPSYYNVFRPYSNYNKDSYSGFEIGMEYSEKFNDLTFKVGGNLMYTESEVVERDEIHEYDYEYRTGKPADAIFGLTDDGFYSESDFTIDQSGNYILNEDLPVPDYGQVQPGDIKYVDMNDDNIIDDSDRSQIGQWSNPWSYGVNLKLNYKGFSLFVLGLGQFGGEGMMSGDYYWIDGDDKYSEVVLDRWTPETANSASYPRLSSESNSNNYRNSTFWMYNDSFFDIQRAQLTYEFSEAMCERLNMKNLSVDIAGLNLMRFSENKDVQQLNTTGNPQFRYFTLGLRTSF